MCIKSNYKIIKSFNAFLRISKASLINLAVLNNKGLFLEAIILLNLFNEGHDWWPKYLLRISVYLVQHNKKWYSLSTTRWLHNLQSLFNRSIPLYLPVSISRLCELNLKLENNFLRLSLLILSK